MLTSLSLVFTDKADSSSVLTPTEQEQVADGLEHNAEVMTNTELEKLLADQPQDAGGDRRHQHRLAADRAPDRAARPP
jgi:hypothetical protein